MFEWDVPLADAETGQVTDYRFTSLHSPDYVNIVGHITSFAVGQCSYETKRKHISNGDPVLVTKRGTEPTLELVQ